MTLKPRHILLLTGIVAVIFSFLFFGRATGIYNKILLSGLALSLVGYILILFKDPVRSILLWTLIVIAGIAIQRFSEPLLIRQSYLYFVAQNESNFLSISQILTAKQGRVSWSQDSAYWERNGLSAIEVNTIKRLVGDAHVINIFKDSTKIYFRTGGLLDVSHGVYYYYRSVEPEERFRKLKGNWYY